MSRDELTGMAELDELARQLETAGRRAELALSRDPAREQEIIGRLRAQLLGGARNPAEAENEHVLLPLRPIVRTRLPGIRLSRSLASGLAACLAVVSLAAVTLAVAAPFWLPRPSPTPTARTTPSPASTPGLVNVTTPNPIGSTNSYPGPTQPPTSTPVGTPTLTPAAPLPTLRPTPTPTPAATPTPVVTPAPVDMGPLNVTANANATYTISWNAYSGPLAISSYALCYTTNENVVFGYVEHFGGVISVARTATSWTGTFPWPATLRVKVEALHTPPAGVVQKAGETQVSIIPYTGPTPTPIPTPTPTATATPTPTVTPPPVVNLGDFLTVQDNHDGTFTFTWTAYSGPLSVAYLISGTTATGSFGYLEDGGYWSDSNPYDQTWTGPITSGSWRIKVEAISTSTGTVIEAAETNIYYLTVP
jgi:hypothetical protein